MVSLGKRYSGCYLPCHLTSRTDWLIYRKWWHTLSNPDDSIPVLIYHKSGEAMSVMNNIINPVTTFYSEKFGDYPFVKIGFATLTAMFPWGGMENQTMVNLMPGGYSDEDLVSHEHSTSGLVT